MAKKINSDNKFFITLAIIVSLLVIISIYVARLVRQRKEDAININTRLDEIYNNLNFLTNRENSFTQLQNEYTKAIQYLDSQEKLPDYLKGQINELIMEFQGKNQVRADNLLDILSLIDVKAYNKVVVEMGVIIENQLKSFIKKEDYEIVFNKKVKFMKFEDLIEYAFEKKIFDKEQYGLCYKIKGLKNDESHKEEREKDKSWEVISILAAKKIILHLDGLIVEKK